VPKRSAAFPVRREALRFNAVTRNDSWASAAPLAASRAGVTGCGSHWDGAPSPTIAHSSRNGATGRCRGPSRTMSVSGIRGVTAPCASTSSVQTGRTRVSAMVCGSPTTQSKASIGVVLAPRRATAIGGVKNRRRIVSLAISVRSEGDEPGDPGELVNPVALQDPGRPGRRDERL